MLETRSATVIRDNSKLIDSVSIAVAPGRLTAVVGPNGSGKSTLLSTLSGDIAPDSGEVLLDKTAISAMRADALAHRRAVLPQSLQLSFPFTVYEVVRLGLRSSASEADARIAEALASVDLGGFGGRFYQTLSGGEQQRVQLARVLTQVWRAPGSTDTPYLLLDEPTSSLDLKHQILTLRTMRSFAAAGGGVLTVLHDLNLAAAFADELLVMSAGREAARGSPAEVLSPWLLQDVFGVDASITKSASGVPYLVPLYEEIP